MNHCLWCQEALDHTYTFFELLVYDRPQSPICDFCRSQLDSLKETIHCEGCGRKQAHSSYCSDCLEWAKVYPNKNFHHTALFTYNAFAKEYMEKFKILGDCELAGLLSRDLYGACKEKGKEALFVPIPISDRSREARGFNQSELLLQKAHIPYMRLLKNQSKEEKQSKKDKRERMATAQPFEVDAEGISILSGKKVVIVDDIYTTGRTLFHASDSLRPYGPSTIETLSLFR
ncbi:phosphoribosyltransferase family protein [Alkalibacterium iburiense]|uniref:Phosphoribosyltransferase family protein n=1 Tax=Alkalibacterium iburiense TaxID=290589 RepID=A0ABP3GW41_9LACT